MNKIGPMSDDSFTLNVETDVLPAVEYPDIYSYLINTPSPYTKEDLKACMTRSVCGSWLEGDSSINSWASSVSWGWSTSLPLQGCSSPTTSLVSGSSKGKRCLSFWKPLCMRGRPFFVCSSHPQPLASSSLGDWKRDRHVVRGCRIIAFSVDKMCWTDPCVLWTHPVLSPNSHCPSSSSFRISREPTKTHSTCFRSLISATNSATTLHHVLSHTTGMHSCHSRWRLSNGCYDENNYQIVLNIPYSKYFTFTFTVYTNNHIRTSASGRWLPCATNTHGQSFHPWVYHTGTSMLCLAQMVTPVSQKTQGGISYSCKALQTMHSEIVRLLRDVKQLTSFSKFWKCESTWMYKVAGATGLTLASSKYFFSCLKREYPLLLQGHLKWPATWQHAYLSL